MDLKRYGHNIFNQQRFQKVLFCLLSDLHGAIGCGQITLPALFDVSSAFNSVDHAILLQHLSVSFGLVGKPLDWLCYFLNDHTSCAIVGASRSH